MLNEENPGSIHIMRNDRKREDNKMTNNNSNNELVH